MSSSDKRRGPGPGGGGSPSRVIRSTASNPVTTTPSPANSAANRAPSLIAPPPRAALSSTSSPAPDDHHNREGGSTTGASAQASRDGLGQGGHGGTNAGTAATQATIALAATVQLVRDKDDRIAYLEQELGIMEAEFQRELDKLSANESETASFWQAKHSALNQQFLRTDTELRLLRAEAEALRVEHEELRVDREAARRALRARDGEIAELRGQVRGLKEWVSNSTRSDGQTRTSDEVFGDGMARLGNGLQNWVIVHFRRAKIDLSGATESALAELGRLVPSYEDLATNAKIHLLQSIVSRILVEVIFDAYFVGLSPEQSKELEQMEKFLTSFSTSPEPINQWRSSTLTILKKDAATKLEAETNLATDNLVTRVNAVLDSITDGAGTPAARDQGLRTLVESSIELSRLLAVQKAEFQVFLPTIQPYQRTMFDAATMEDIGGEELDEDGLAGREICCATFPGIVKRGDENGGQLQFRNVIAKARVLCSPE